MHSFMPLHYRSLQPMKRFYVKFKRRKALSFIHCCFQQQSVAYNNTFHSRLSFSCIKDSNPGRSTFAVSEQASDDVFSGLSVPLLIEGATFQKVHDGAKVLMSWKELFSCVKNTFQQFY